MSSTQSHTVVEMKRESVSAGTEQEKIQLVSPLPLLTLSCFGHPGVSSSKGHRASFSASFRDLRKPQRGLGRDT